MDMTRKKKRFSFFTYEDELKKFLTTCKRLDTDGAKELRKFMKEFNRKNGNVLNFGGAK
jgi:hypothetical protein